MREDPTVCMAVVKSLGNDGLKMDLCEHLPRALGVHGAAFSADFITLERFMHVVITPYLQLFQKTCSEERKGPAADDLKGAQVIVRDSLFTVWSTAIASFLSGKLVPNSQGIPVCCPLMSPGEEGRDG